MNYYPFHIGDYRSGTSHLSDEEDLAYRRALDWYYDTEAAIPLDTQWVSRRLRVDTQVLENVLRDFFSKTDEGWRHARCDAEIAAYQKLREKNRANGAKGGRKPKQSQSYGNPVGFQSVSTGNQEETHSEGNQEPRTKNQEPRTRNQEPSSPSPDGEGSAAPHRDAPQAELLPPVVSIPLIDKSEFGVSSHQLAEWQETYPAVNVLQQLREMRAWCIANPSSRKTARGVARFVVSWLGKEQDRAPRAPGLAGSRVVNRQEAIEQRNREIAQRWAQDQEDFEYAPE